MPISAALCCAFCKKVETPERQPRLRCLHIIDHFSSCRVPVPPSTTPSCLSTAVMVPKKHFTSSPKADVLHIPAVQLCLFGDFQLVPAMDLRPAGQPGAYIVCTVLIPFGQQVVLVPKRWARADDRHIPHKDIPQLGQLVQTGLAQKASHAGDILLRVVQQMGGHIVGGYQCA